LQQMMYRHKISDSDWMKHVLIDCWTQLSQNILNLPKILIMVIKAKGVHVEFHLELFSVQMIAAVTFNCMFKLKLGKIHAFLLNSRIVEIYAN